MHEEQERIVKIEAVKKSLEIEVKVCQYNLISTKYYMNYYTHYESLVTYITLKNTNFGYFNESQFSHQLRTTFNSYIFLKITKIILHIILYTLFLEHLCPSGRG